MEKARNGRKGYFLVEKNKGTVGAQGGLDGAVLWWEKLEERWRRGGDRETKGGRCCFGC